MAEVLGCHSCDYVRLYKPPSQQTRVRASSAGLEEVSQIQWDSIWRGTCGRDLGSPIGAGSSIQPTASKTLITQPLGKTFFRQYESA